MNITFATQGGAADRPNEDWVAATPDTVVVLDGVTAPRVSRPGCRHPVTWFVGALGASLLWELRGGGSISGALAEAIGRVNTLHPECDLASPGVPAAAVAVLRQHDGWFEHLVLADVTVAVETAGEVRAVSDHRVDEAAPAELEATRAEAIGTPEHAAAVARMSVAQLERRNVPGGYWVASTDPRAGEHALTGETLASEVRRAAVLTDGASRAVDTFGAMDWPGVLDYLDEHGPAGLIRAVRLLEGSDPGGRAWPRFKRSDDATVALIRV